MAATYPVQPEQLTNEWLTAALTDAGALTPGRSVTDFSVTNVGDGLGLLGLVMRADITYDVASPVPGPDSIVIKFATPVEARNDRASARPRATILFTFISLPFLVPSLERPSWPPRFVFGCRARRSLSSTSLIPAPARLSHGPAPVRHTRRTGRQLGCRTALGPWNRWRHCEMDGRPGWTRGRRSTSER